MIRCLNSETLSSGPSVSKEFQDIIDRLGIQSGVVQNLNGPITSIEKLSQIPDQYLLVYHQTEDEDSEPVGYLKYGFKNLYFYKKDGKIIEKQSVPCVLDFYILETLQRHGIGLELFERMLSTLSLHAYEFAYDRPSPKLLSFLRKHFNLQRPDHQPNRYVIYPAEGYSL